MIELMMAYQVCFLLLAIAACMVIYAVGRLIYVWMMW